MNDVIDCIAIKRDGGVLDTRQWQAIVEAIVDGSMSDAQLGAFAMAVRCQHLDRDEQSALTREMATQGETFDWPAAGFTQPVLDKHSTGGIGDKVSFILAPVLAACGALVPMISGRALGHTGGTLDKLDAIPGYQTSADRQSIQRALTTAGCAIVGQTSRLVPADKRLYAIRDQTATIDEQGLIVASILSKKIAAGLDALIMDVKTGNGAFMQTPSQAMELAGALTAVANRAGLQCEAIISDMNQVLGHSAGNALEILEAVACLTRHASDSRLEALTLHLAGRLLRLGGLSATCEMGEQAARQALDSGLAAEHFARMVSALGGPSDFVESIGQHLPVAPIVQPVLPGIAGFVERIDVRAIGRAIIALGGGRRTANQALDYSVGFTDIAGLGAQAALDLPLAFVHAASMDDAQRAARTMREAFVISSNLAPALPLITANIDNHSH